MKVRRRVKLILFVMNVEQRCPNLVDFVCDECANRATVVGDPKEQYWTGLLSDQITFTGVNATDCTEFC